jgi:hypothetical protein
MLLKHRNAIRPACSAKSSALDSIGQLESRMEEIVNATEEKKCAHPGCSCEVSGDQEYCSPQCEQSATSGAQQSASPRTQGRSDCGCNHAECRMAA